jgi:hypothetical protein
MPARGSRCCVLRTSRSCAGTDKWVESGRDVRSDGYGNVEHADSRIAQHALSGVGEQVGCELDTAGGVGRQAGHADAVEDRRRQILWKRHELETVLARDGLVLDDVIHFARFQQRRELGGVRAHVLLQRARHERVARARAVVVAVHPANQVQCVRADRRDGGIGAPDAHAALRQDAPPVLRCDRVAMHGSRAVGHAELIRGEAHIPGKMRRRQRRHDVVVRKHDDIGDASEVGELARVLERSSYLDERGDSRDALERIGERPQRARERRGREDGDGRSRPGIRAGAKRQRDRDEGEAHSRKTTSLRLSRSEVSPLSKRREWASASGRCPW